MNTGKKHWIRAACLALCLILSLNTPAQALRVLHNIAAMNAYRNYGTINKANSLKNLEKLSSGYRINRAGDDAAGLAASEKMRAQITGIEGTQKQAKDGISLVQTAEGALDEVRNMLNRMFDLAKSSADGDPISNQNQTNVQESVNTSVSQPVESEQQTPLLSIQSRVEDALSGLATLSEDMKDAETTVRDTDAADEMMKYTKNNILLQAAQAMLAQANQNSSGVLSLLGGDGEVQTPPAQSDAAAAKPVTTNDQSGTKNIGTTGNETVTNQDTAHPTDDDGPLPEEPSYEEPSYEEPSYEEPADNTDGGICGNSSAGASVIPNSPKEGEWTVTRFCSLHNCTETVVISKPDGLTDIGQQIEVLLQVIDIGIKIDEYDVGEKALGSLTGVFADHPELDFAFKNAVMSVVNECLADNSEDTETAHKLVSQMFDANNPVVSSEVTENEDGTTTIVRKRKDGTQETITAHLDNVPPEEPADEEPAVEKTDEEEDESLKRAFYELLNQFKEQRIAEEDYKAKVEEILSKILNQDLKAGIAAEYHTSIAKPALEKYINKDVHQDLPAFDTPFTYDILAFVTGDADRVVLNDPLVTGVTLGTGAVATSITELSLGAFTDGANQTSAAGVAAGSTNLGSWVVPAGIVAGAAILVGGTWAIIEHQQPAKTIGQREQTENDLGQSLNNSNNTHTHQYMPVKEWSKDHKVFYLGQSCQSCSYKEITEYLANVETKKEPTCTTKGKRIYTVTIEGFSIDPYEEEIPIDSNAHVPAEPVIDMESVVERTCTAGGSYDLVTRCKLCNAVVSSEHKTTTAMGHSHAPIDSAYDPTCEETGITAGDWCPNCGIVFTAQQAIPMVDHDWSDWEVVEEPTYTEEGLEQRVCAYNTNHIETRPISKLTPPTPPEPEPAPHEHTPGEAAHENEVASTSCKEEGRGHYDLVTRCAICGEELSREENLPLDPLPHNFVTYVSDDDDTCQQDGHKTASCEYHCGTVNQIVDTGSKDTSTNHVGPLTTYYHQSYDNDVYMIAWHKDCTVCGRTVESGTTQDEGMIEDDWVDEEEQEGLVVEESGQ